jgi:hypothetical protein
MWRLKSLYLCSLKNEKLDFKVWTTSNFHIKESQI